MFYAINQCKVGQIEGKVYTSTLEIISAHTWCCYLTDSVLDVSYTVCLKCVQYCKSSVLSWHWVPTGEWRWLTCYSTTESKDDRRAGGNTILYVQHYPWSLVWDLYLSRAFKSKFHWIKRTLLLLLGTSDIYVTLCVSLSIYHTLTLTTADSPELFQAFFARPGLGHVLFFFSVRPFQSVEEWKKMEQFSQLQELFLLVCVSMWHGEGNTLIPQQEGFGLEPNTDWTYACSPCACMSFLFPQFSPYRCACECECLFISVLALW